MKASRSAKDASEAPWGQRAALFPALSEGSREKRAVSILLACMEQAPELADSLLRGQGATLGRRSRLQAWTEAGPIGIKGAERPDGRIEVRSSRGQTWVALLEVKIGKAALDSAQIGAYLAEARAAGADALITVSNDFAVLPNHHPTYRGRVGKGIALLHWSWSSILTKCRLLSNGGEIEDRDHLWLIEHLVRFLAQGLPLFNKSCPGSARRRSRRVRAVPPIRATCGATRVNGGEKPGQGAEQESATTVVGVRQFEGAGSWFGAPGAGNEVRA